MAVATTRAIRGAPLLFVLVACAGTGVRSDVRLETRSTLGPAGAAAPRMIVVITDDQGFGDLGVHGNDEIRTPNLDAFARQGTQLTRTRGFAPPRIHVGSGHENPILLTRQDWRGPRAGWAAESLGHWEIEVARGGSYDVRLRFRKAAGAMARLRLGAVDAWAPVPDGADTVMFGGLSLPAGPGRVEPEIVVGGQSVGVEYVEIERR